MARKRRGRPVHGWIIIDKPLGLSSSAAVGKVKRLLDAQKAGHGGTLDPLATGVLPIALGEATKTMNYVMDGHKAYRFTVRWGAATKTDDGEGDIVEVSDHRPGADDIEKILPAFTGEIDQVPPAYSAIKVDGKRAYALARKDEHVELEARRVFVEALALVRMIDEDHAEFEMTCGKGTYVRSLGRDMARKLGTVGHITALRRTAVGPFFEDCAISLDYLEGLGHIAPDSEPILPIETVLDDIPALALTEEEARKLRHGQAVSILPVLSRIPEIDISQGDIVSAMSGGRLVALAELKGGEIRPFRVMNL
jgi:tRNA pseudouridine55 synthase